VYKRQGLHELIKIGKIQSVDFGNKPNLSFVSTDAFMETLTKTKGEIGRLHQEYPTRKGFNLSEISKRTRIEETFLTAILGRLVISGEIISDGKIYCLAGSMISYSPTQEKALQKIYARIDQSPYSPPTLSELIENIGSGFTRDLIKNGQFIQVSPDILFREKEYQVMVSFVDELLEKNQKITVSDLRDRFQTSRKYIIPFLEHMDRIKKTRRVGDERIKY
jgi:selenocysteine-specific elongation factor